MTNGYYYAEFQSVTMTCYDAKSPPGTNTGVSYTYNNVAGTNDTVVDGDKPTVLKSLQGSGLNMNAGDPSSSSASASASGTKQSSAPESIPGMSGGSPGSNPDASAGAGTPSSSGSAGGSDSGSGSGSGSNSGSDGSFDQGSTGSGGTSSSSGSSLNQEKVLKGSVFAAIVAVVGMMAL